MEQLVTPNDPVVTVALQAAKNAVPTNQAPTTITDTNYYTFSLSNNNLNDFDLIIDWVNKNCIYTLDKVNYGVTDYWSTPAETIANGSGDCEDYAILLCSLLRAYGVPADQVYVAVGIGPEGENHAWVVEEYFTGLWRVLDEQTGSSIPLVFGSDKASAYIASYCFNDTTGFNGSPVLPGGVYEFESADTAYPQDDGASDSYYRYVNAGQKITAQVNWLPYSVFWPFDPNILEPWSFNIYDENGKELFSWSGEDLEKTVEYTVPQTAIYRIEIVKREDPPRPARLTLFPQQGWTTGTPLKIDLLAADQPAFPVSYNRISIPEPQVNTVAPTTKTAVPIAAPLTVPQGQLEQYALGVINNQLVQSGQSSITLGTNTAAQQHADDMLAHDFASDWGTDGTTPWERYSTAGGLGAQTEYDYRTAIDWDGNPSSFARALLAAIDKSESNLAGVLGFTTTIDTSGNISNSPIPEQIKMQPDKVNFGIAYNGSYLYLVVQYEVYYAIFNQLPTIKDGVLTCSFTEQNIAHTDIDVRVLYQRAPTPLTTSQISYASQGDSSQRVLAIFGLHVLSILDREPNAIFPSGSSSVFADPLWVPPGASPRDEASCTLNNLSFGLNTTSSSYIQDDFTGINQQGNQTSVSFDMSSLISTFGKGIYTISLVGRVYSTILPTIQQLPWDEYTIFVK
jgi:predicted transglutaminase-like cysteine proteinase